MSVLIKLDNTDKLQVHNNTDAVNKLYYELATLPSQKEIDDYNKKNNTTFELEKLKNIISETNTVIPLFDIVSQNIYLISANQVFDYVKENHYRIATEKIYNFLKLSIISIAFFFFISLYSTSKSFFFLYNV